MGTSDESDQPSSRLNQRSKILISIFIIIPAAGQKSGMEVMSNLDHVQGVPGSVSLCLQFRLIPLHAFFNHKGESTKLLKWDFSEPSTKWTLLLIPQCHHNFLHFSVWGCPVDLSKKVSRLTTTIQGAQLANWVAMASQRASQALSTVTQFGCNCRPEKYLERWQSGRLHRS